MKSLLSISLVLLVLTTARAQDKPLLVDVQWLHEHKNVPGLVILQVNSMQLDYEQEHIEGARFLWPGWLAPDSPEGNMNLPDLKAASEVLRKLGISNDSHIILCHARNEVSATARMFLMLEYLGMQGRVSFLNGGLEAWKKELYPVTREVPVFKAGAFKASPKPVVVDRHYVQKHLNSETVKIVDARAKRFYDGDPVGYPRDGHIKGASNVPYQELVDQNNLFKSPQGLQTYFDAATPDKSKELVAYCFIGQTASVVYLAGRLLGYNMKLYDGSMQEWSRIPELPMEKTEN
jgi:thiosulfate/3-mercaptopyruvate sulfurtransferase